MATGRDAWYSPTMTHTAPFTLYRLRPGDEAGFTAMLDTFAEGFEDDEHYRRAPPGAAYRDKLLADDTFIALVARDGDQTVGALAGYELKKFEQERSEFYIYDLAVVETHRRRGIATALIEGLGPGQE